MEGVWHGMAVPQLPKLPQQSDLDNISDISPALAISDTDDVRSDTNRAADSHNSRILILIILIRFLIAAAQSILYR
jgi:hypothetical protein